MGKRGFLHLITGAVELLILNGVVIWALHQSTELGILAAFNAIIVEVMLVYRRVWLIHNGHADMLWTIHLSKDQPND